MRSLKQYKIARRLGARIFSKTQNPKFVLEVRNRNRSQKRRSRQLSEYGMQLIEKQKVRYTYNLNERQFASYVKTATSKRGVNPVEKLYEILESRLDNVLFRLGIAETRHHARQLVSHGHVEVNGRRLNIPSYQSIPGDKIGIKPQSKEKTFLKERAHKMEKHSIPAWLSFDWKQVVGIIEKKPIYDTASEDIFNLTSVIEFYSR